MRVWKSGPMAPCTNFPQGENSKPYQAAPPSGRGARTCCLSDGRRLSVEVAKPTVLAQGWVRGGWWSLRPLLGL